MGGEDGGRALGDRVVELLDEDRAALAQLGHDVLVVDDLLAHVDRRAVELERALDGLDGAIDAGAVAARGGEQQPLGRGQGGGGHHGQCRRQASAPRSSSSTVSPLQSSERAETALMSSQRSCQQGKSKSMRSIAGTPSRANGVWSSMISRPRAGREDGRAPTRRAAARRRAHSRGSDPSSRGIRRSLVGDEVEQDDARAARRGGGARRPSSRAGRRGRSRRCRRSPPPRRRARSAARARPRGASSGAARARARAPPRSRPRRRWRRRSRGSPSCRSARRRRPRACCRAACRRRCAGRAGTCS